MTTVTAFIPRPDLDGVRARRWRGVIRRAVIALYVVAIVGAVQMGMRNGPLYARVAGHTIEFNYLSACAILGLLACGAALTEWLVVRRRQSLWLATVALVTFSLLLSDAAWHTRAAAAFSLRVEQDGRYRTHVQGWSRDTNYVTQILRHQKLDQSMGPYTAGFHCSLLDSPFRIDGAGFRRHSDRELAGGEPIILCLGGSNTFGMTTQATDVPYPDLLEDRLVSGPLSRWRVVNGGLPGMRIEEAGVLLAQWRPLQPKIVVFCEAYNDIPLVARAPRPRHNSAVISWIERWWVDRKLAAHLSVYRASDYRRNLEALIAQIRESGSEPVLATHPMAYASTAPQHVLDYYDVMRAGHGSAYAAARLVEIHNDQVRTIAREHSILWVDVAEQLTGRGVYFIDGCHLTQSGRERVAAMMARALTPLALGIDEAQSQMAGAFDGSMDSECP